MTVARAAETQGNAPLLEVEDLSVNYAGVKAVSSVSLRVFPGEVVGIIGPNGAGKSTLVNAITGVTPSEGAVSLAQQDLKGRRPYQRARAGIARTFQTPFLFNTLSAAENVLLAASVAISTSQREARKSDSGSARPDHGSAAARVDESLRTLNLESRAEIKADSMSGGERKILELARVLAQHPKLLILDEPAAGVASGQRAAMLDGVREYVDRTQSSCVLIEHDMDLIRQACDWLYVISSGQLICEGDWSVISADYEVRRAYLGTSS